MNKTRMSFFIDMFSKLTTAIFLFSSIYIYIFNGFQKNLSVKLIWGILAEAFLITLGYLPFVTEKEIPKTRYLILNILYFIFTDLVVLGFGFYFGWFSIRHPITIVAMEITFVITYAVVYLIMYMSVKRSAEKMNEQLKKMKQA